MKTRLSKGPETDHSISRHVKALETSSYLTDLFRQMYRPMAGKVTPKKVVKVLKDAGVVGLLMGTHGVGAWRSEPRATQDVDILVKKRDHSKAVRAIHEAFPRLAVKDAAVVTRFLDPESGVSLIDLMRPADELFKVAFRFSIPVGDSHRVPSLEMAIASKFAAMVSRFRSQEKKLIDGGDFYNIVRTNLEDIDLNKLKILAEKVYQGGYKEMLNHLEDIKAGRRIEF
jgi:hypothetical protein